MKSCQVRNNVINQSTPLNEYKTTETMNILVITPRFYFYREFWRLLSFWFTLATLIFVIHRRWKLENSEISNSWCYFSRLIRCSLSAKKGLSRNCLTYPANWGSNGIKWKMYTPKFISSSSLTLFVKILSLVYAKMFCNRCKCPSQVCKCTPLTKSR